MALYRVMIDSSASSLERKTCFHLSGSILFFNSSKMTRKLNAANRGTRTKVQWTPVSVWLALLSLTVMASVSSLRSVCPARAVHCLQQGVRLAHLYAGATNWRVMNPAGLHSDAARLQNESGH